MSEKKTNKTYSFGPDINKYLGDPLAFVKDYLGDWEKLKEDYLSGHDAHARRQFKFLSDQTGKWHAGYTMNPDEVIAGLDVAFRAYDGKALASDLDGKNHLVIELHIAGRIWRHDVGWLDEQLTPEEKEQLVQDLLANIKPAMPAPKLRKPHLTLGKTAFKWASPYNPDAVSDLKTLPLNQRKWDKVKRVWELAPTKDVFLFMIEHSKRYYGTEPELLTDGTISAKEFLEGKAVDQSTHYATLRVKPTATATELKKAFYKLAAQEHPDQGGDHDLFIAIKRAYDVLKDPMKRKRYDAALRLMNKKAKGTRVPTDAANKFRHSRPRHRYHY